jgi:hypothetical protein
MADKRISQLVDRGTVANSDVVPIVVSGASTTNKATISSIQTFMQGNLDLGVTSVGITLGSSGTDVSVSGSPVTSSGNITINLPTASATNRGLLSAADWSTFNGKANAADYVTLATAQTITGQKTFTASGGSDSVIISTSGSGFSLDAIKSGNGEVIRVNKTSGTGNAMTVIGGNFEAPTIVKTGGTSSQFLKADGSVDSSTYLTTGSAGSTYVPYTGAAASVNLGVYSITANSINSAGSGSTAGQINLRSDAFFSLVNGYGSIASGTTNQFNLYQTTGAGVFRGAILSLNSITASATRTYTLPDADGTLALSGDLGSYLPLAGGTLTGALNGTSALFGSAWTAGGSVAINTWQRLGGAVSADITYNDANISINFGTSTSHTLNIKTNNTTALSLASTGAATFSSSVNIGASATTGKQLIVNQTGASGYFLSGEASGTEIGYWYYDASSIQFSSKSATRALTFLTSDAERMRITSGGEVLIGMQLTGGTSTTSVRAGYVSGQSNTSANEVLAGWNQATSGDNKFVAFYTEANGVLRGTIDYNRAAGLVRYNVTSDKNLKNIIGDSDKIKSIEILNSTRIREYSWKEDESNKPQIGVIAQELFETYKGAVSVGSDEELLGTEDYKPWGVDKTAFTFHLIAGFQEHERIIKELQAQIDSLKNQIK